MRLDSHSPGSSLRSLQGIMTSPPQSHSRSLMDTFSTPFPVESFPAFSYDEADSLNKSLFSDGIMTPFPKRPGATTAAFRSSSSTSSRPMMILAAIRISIGSDETVGTNIRNKKISQKVSISPISKNAWKGSFLNDDDELSQTLRSLKPAKEDDRDDADPSQETLDDHMEQADKDNNKDELDKAIMPPPTAPRVRIDDTVQIATFSNSHQKLTRLSISSSCSRNSAATTPRNLNREQGEELSSSSSSLLKAPSTVDMDRAMKDMATPSTAAMSELGGNTSFMSNEMSPVPMSLTPAATVAAASSEKKPKAAVVGDESFDLDKKELGSSSAAVAAETSSPLGNVETDNRTTTTSKRPAEADDVDLPEAKRSKQEQQQHVKQ